MEIARSADGTQIAFERSGTGPPLIIVGGAFNTRRSPADLAPLLAPEFTVVVYDRRGRGDSTNTAPYAAAREVEDLEALAVSVGSPVMLYGHSSGGALVLDAAAAGMPVSRLAVYEPPYRLPGDPPLPPDYLARVNAAVDSGQLETVAKLFFLEAAGMPQEAYTSMTRQPYWPDMVAVAHTIPYEHAIVGDRLPTDHLARIAAPTLVIDGGLSAPSAHAVTDAVAAAVPGAERVTVADQEHAPSPAAVAPVLLRFFGRTGGGGAR